MVDTQGLVLAVRVHEAGIADATGAKQLLAPLGGQFPRLLRLWADSAYQWMGAWVWQTLGWELEVVRHPWSGGRWMAADAAVPVRPRGFQVLPRRWVVERTFAWLGRNRRLAKDYEALPETEEAFIYFAMIRLMLRRRTRPILP